MVIFDKFPSTKVKDLLQIMNTGGDTAAPQPSRNSLSGNSSSPILQFCHGTVLRLVTC